MQLDVIIFSFLNHLKLLEAKMISEHEGHNNLLHVFLTCTLIVHAPSTHHIVIIKICICFGAQDYFQSMLCSVINLPIVVRTAHFGSVFNCPSILHESCLKYQSTFTIRC